MVKNTQNHNVSFALRLNLHAYLAVGGHLVHFRLWTPLKRKSFQFLPIVVTRHRRLNRTFCELSIEVLGIHVVLYPRNEWRFYLLPQQLVPIDWCEPGMIFDVENFLHPDLGVFFEQAGQQIF